MSLPRTRSALCCVIPPTLPTFTSRDIALGDYAPGATLKHTPSQHVRCIITIHIINQWNSVDESNWRIKKTNLFTVVAERGKLQGWFSSDQRDHGPRLAPRPPLVVPPQGGPRRGAASPPSGASLEDDQLLQRTAQGGGCSECNNT